MKKFLLFAGLTTVLSLGWEGVSVKINAATAVESEQLRLIQGYFGPTQRHGDAERRRHTRGFGVSVVSHLGNTDSRSDSFESFECPLGSKQFGARCGYVTVPEDHFDPNNPNTLKIAVAIVSSGRSSFDPEDPIVYLEGGPGYGPLKDSFEIASSLTDNRVRREIVVIDQRGTGLSQPRLNCPEVATFARAKLNEAESDRAYMGRFFDSLQACFQRLREEGANLAVFNSAQNAADVIAVSKALGYEQINLYGASYGARLALTILRDFGDTGYIRSATIGGVYAPDATATDMGGIAAEALERVFVACAADSGCRNNFPNLRQVFYDTVDQLNGEPVEIDFLDFATGEERRARIDGTLFFDAIFFKLFSRQGIASIPAFIDGVSQGDTSQLEPVFFLFDLYDWGMNMATQCYEEFSLISPAEVAAAEARTPQVLRSWWLRNPESSPLLVDFCGTLGLPQPPELEDLPVTSDVPTLVISGAFDPLTPESMAKQAMQNLTQAYAYVVPDAGHDAIAATDCAKDITDRFIANPSQAPDSDCLEESRIEFQGR